MFETTALLSSFIKVVYGNLNKRPVSVCFFCGSLRAIAQKILPEQCNRTEPHRTQVRGHHWCMIIQSSTILYNESLVTLWSQFRYGCKPQTSPWVWDELLDGLLVHHPSQGINLRILQDLLMIHWDWNWKRAPEYLLDGFHGIWVISPGQNSCIRLDGLWGFVEICGRRSHHSLGFLIPAALFVTEIWMQPKTANEFIVSSLCLGWLWTPPHVLWEIYRGFVVFRGLPQMPVIQADPGHL